MLIAAADVGSIARKRFAWSTTDRHGTMRDGRTPDEFTLCIAEAVATGELVALGFESPLVLPIPEHYEDLGRARVGESTRSWSASAGASVMGTGLVQLAWVLSAMRGVGGTVLPSRWSQQAPLLLWEAYVSGDLKTDRSDATGHSSDAQAAVRGFAKVAAGLPALGRIHLGEHRALNLAVAAAMAVGVEIATDEIDVPLLIIDGA